MAIRSPIPCRVTSTIVPVRVPDLKGRTRTASTPGACPGNDAPTAKAVYQTIASLYHLLATAHTTRTGSQGWGNPPPWWPCPTTGTDRGGVGSPGPQVQHRLPPLTSAVTRKTLRTRHSGSVGRCRIGPSEHWHGLCVMQMPTRGPSDMKELFPAAGRQPGRSAPRVPAGLPEGRQGSTDPTPVRCRPAAVWNAIEGPVSYDPGGLRRDDILTIDGLPGPCRTAPLGRTPMPGRLGSQG